MLATLIMLKVCNAMAYEHYSVFDDNADLSAVQANHGRTILIMRDIQGHTTASADYLYNQQGKVTQGDYADSTLNYTYNDQGFIESVHALMKHGVMNTYVQHTKENFISEYTYGDQGEVISEHKKVFNDQAVDLSGTPISTFDISYSYDPNGKLIQRREVPVTGENISEKEFHYTYHNDDIKLKKIREVRLSTPQEESTLLLEYYSNGEIKKATQSRFGKGTKTIEMEYFEDGLIYSPYYADPVKEWKVDVDFFGRAFHPIKLLKQTVDGQVKTYNYLYQDNNGDSLPDSLELSISLSNGENYLFNYSLTNN